jgi:hypothetical protein
MVLPRAQSRLATLADQSVRLDAPQGYADVAGRLGANWSANAYWDGSAWQRHDTATGATLLTLNPGGTYTLRTAAAGANPIVWATTTSFAADTGWQAPTLAAGWTNFAGGFTVAGYKRDATGRVHLRGLIQKNVAIVAGDVPFTLPAGFRPTGAEMFDRLCQDGAQKRIDVGAAGGVAVQTGTAGAAWVTLAGISFDTV